jgi:hypothetical protein
VLSAAIVPQIAHLLAHTVLAFLQAARRCVLKGAPAMASDTEDKGRTPPNPLEKLGKEGQKILHNQDAGTGKAGAVEGVGNVGGSSGAGAVRVPVSDGENLSGIESDLQPDDPEAAAEEKLFSDAGRRVMSDTQHRISGDGGNKGRTAGPNSEAIPNSKEGKPTRNNPNG